MEGEEEGDDGQDDEDRGGHQEVELDVVGWEVKKVRPIERVYLLVVEIDQRTEEVVPGVQGPKRLTAPRAGHDWGMMTWKRMRSSLAPSRRAASEISCGICMKNWRRRKIQNGEAEEEGDHKRFERVDPLHPGEDVEEGDDQRGKGMKTVARTTMKILSRPGHWIREKP